jgi:hypothetical protein
VLAALAPRTPHGPFQTRHEERAIAQPGQIVVKRRVAEVVLGQPPLFDFACEALGFRLGRTRPSERLIPLDALRDVALHRDEMRPGTRLVGDRHHAELHPIRRGIFSIVEYLEPDGLAPRERIAQRRACGGIGAGPVQDPRTPSQQLGRRIPRHRFERGVDEHDRRTGCVERLGTGDEDRVARMRDGGFQ